MRDGLLPFKVLKTSKKQMNIVIIFSVAFHSFPFQHIPPSIDANVRIFQQQASPVHVFFFFHRNTVHAFTAYPLADVFQNDIHKFHCMRSAKRSPHSIGLFCLICS